MPGESPAIATTRLTVVRDGPWMCNAEMVASIRRCRARTLPGRESAGSAAAPVTEEAVEADMARVPALTEARRRTGQAHFGDPRAQQIVELEHPGLDLRERS